MFWYYTYTGLSTLVMFPKYRLRKHHQRWDKYDFLWFLVSPTLITSPVLLVVEAGCNRSRGSLVVRCTGERRGPHTDTICSFRSQPTHPPLNHLFFIHTSFEKICILGCSHFFFKFSFYHWCVWVWRDHKKLVIDPTIHSGLFLALRGIYKGAFPKNNFQQ